MKYLKLKFLLMFFALAMAIPPAWAETVIDFKETFDQCSGTGGNDGSFSGTGNNNIVADKDGWTFTKGNGANKCAKFGTSSAKGNAQTPWINVTSGTTYTLTFKIGGWSGDTYQWIYVDLYGGTWSTQTSYNLSVNYSAGQWTECSYTFTANDPTIYINFRANNNKNNRFFLDEVVVSHEENTTPSTDPWVTVNPSSLTINDVVGDNNKFEVSARNIRDWQNLGITPNNGFSVTGTSTTGNTWYNENGNTGFYSNSEHSADGTVTVAYEGRELIATGNINCGTDGAEPKNVAVNYRSDVYIFNDNGNDSWNFTTGNTKMDYANDKYSTTITTNNDNTCILFGRTTGENYRWEHDWTDGVHNRLFFGAYTKNNGDEWMYGTNKSGNLDLNPADIDGHNKYSVIKFPDAGTYTITIDPKAKTFSIVSTNVANIAEAQAFDGRFNFTGNAVVTYHNHDSDGNYYTWIRDVANRDGEVNSGLIKGSVDGTFINGDVLNAGWKATKNVENTGVIDFINPEGVTSEVNNGPVAPYALTELTDADINKYVSMSGLTVTRVNSWQYTVTADGTNTFYIYDQFHVTDGHKLEVDKTYNVVGVVSRYNGNPQLYLISAEEVKELKVTLTSDTKTSEINKTIPVTVTVENAEGDYAVTYKFGENGTENTLTGETINVTSETAGEVVLIVNVTNGDNHATATETYTFTEPVQPGSNVFVKVTDTSQLKEGSKCIFVLNDIAMGPLTSGNTGFGNCIDITVIDATHVEINDNVDVFTIEPIDQYNYKFKDKDQKYLVPQAGNDTGLKKEGSDGNGWHLTTSFGVTSNLSDGSYGIKKHGTMARFGHYKTSNDYSFASLYVQTLEEQEPLAISLTPAPAEPYTVGDNVTVTATVENGSENTAVTYKIGEGEWQNYPEGGIVLPNTAAGDVVVTVKAVDGTNDATDEVTYHFNAADAFEITLTNTPDQETYKVNDVVNVKVNVAKAIGNNVTITYTIGETREAIAYNPETGINITSATAGTVPLTVNVTDGYEHAGESSKTANYVFVKKDITLAFGDETPTSVYKGNEITLTVTGAPEGATVTFECTPENAVTFDGNKATFNTEGEVTITAKTAETAEYNAGTATYTITVEAKPFVTADPTSLDFEAVIGNDPVEKTFTVMAENLKGDITLTMTESEVFTITPATITMAEAMTENGKTVTVTYNPTAATGEDFDKATITIKSKDAEDVTVSLTGMATLPDPELTVTPGTLEMGTNPTGTFTVTGQHLTENVTLTVTEGTAANFVITPATITPDEEGKVNQEITVTYKGNNTEDEYATITVKSGIAKKEVIVTARVLPTPELIADPESLTMTAVVGQTPATATFTVMAEDLRGDITLTLSETDAFTINPATIAKANMTEDGVEVTVTYTPTQAGNDNATITIASEAAESVTVTLNGTATVPEVVAAPTFSLVAGTYGEAQQLTISAESGATILYSTDGSEPTTPYNGAISLGEGTTTVKAVATKDGFANSPVVTATYIIDIPEELPTITPFKGYYQIKNNENNKYANIAGRKTLNFTDAPADKAGTVIWLETNDKGQVQSIRSQAADLQGYANRAMRYVPQMVDIVVNKINEMEGIENATGAGSVLGETGLDAIMEKFNECFDYHLYVEQAQGGWRLYGKTPNMQHVVDFYRDHKDQVEAKLPKLEGFINDALHKLINKIGGSTVFTDFSLRQIWENMGGNLPEPVVGDDAAIMDFYRAVLNNKNYVWDFAYQTAQIYWNNVKDHPRYDELKAQLGEYADYIDEFVNQVRPDFKYYVIQRGNEPDYISEGNGEIINNDPRTLWTLEPRTDFTVNIAGEQFGCPYAGGVGGYATTNYTDFAYTVPEGVTAYKVASVENGVASLQALSGVIPAQTPVLLMAKTAKDYVLTLSTEAGTKVTGNLLVGVDSLITRFQLKTPMVETLFNLAQGVLGEQLYNQYVAQYEYLQLLYAGTVNNKYFWGLTRDDVMKCLNANGDDCVVRDLSGSKFIDNRQVKTNKAFLVSETDQTITISTLRGDVNHDGYVNIDDVTALIDYLLEVDGRACPYCANVNCDSTVNIVDVTYLIDILLGNISPYAEGGNGN